MGERTGSGTAEPVKPKPKRAKPPLPSSHAVTKAKATYRAPRLPFATGLGYIAGHLEGGKNGVMQLAALSSHEAMRKAVILWESKSEGDRNRTPLEAIAAGVGLQPEDFLAELVRSAYKQNLDVSHLLAMTAHPRVVQKTIEFAMEKEGHRDREILFKHSGFMPIPQGSRTTLNVLAQASAAAATETGERRFETRVLRSAEATRDVVTEVVDESPDAECTTQK